MCSADAGCLAINYQSLLQVWSSRTHDETHGCLCKENDSWDGGIDLNPLCPVKGHSNTVTRVRFSDDGAQVISASCNERKVCVWDVASGRRVRLLEGDTFVLVEGLSDEHKRGRHVLTANGDTLLIFESAKGHDEDGAAAASVACFKAPDNIASFRCHGSVICVGCEDGAVMILSAPFLAV